MSRCEGCGGEDCACCGVFLEDQANIKYGRMYEDDGYDEFEPFRYDDEEE